jgi:heterodisulfide reductase subunit C
MDQSAAAKAIDTGVARRLGEKAGIDVLACYQCEKCTNGCPVVFAMDHPPHRIIRMVQLGLIEEAASAKTPWVCASCETCGTRCPNAIDIPGLMDRLKNMAKSSGRACPEPSVLDFHQSFLNNIRRFGRVNEAVLMGEYQLRASLGPKGVKIGDLWDQAVLGLKMMRRGRLSIWPKKAEGLDRVKRIFGK